MTSDTKKKLYIKTYGCQMNVYDSQRMVDVLSHHGYETVDAPDAADLVILNTCHIREKAAEKVYSELGRLREIKEKKIAAGGGDMALAVAGCVAQAEGEEMTRRAPFVDMVFGPQTYHRLPEMITRMARKKNSSARGAALVNTEFPVESKFDFLPEESQNTNAAAFLSVQEGCDKFCTFCVVPYTRGAESSRPVADILKEARTLVRRGALEINLLGQNVNAYHGLGADGAEWTLGRLLFALAEIDGLKRLRYTTSHPMDMHDDLYAAHAQIPHLMPFLHLPVQAGSDTVLKAMNRSHTVADYRRVIDRLRTARADMAFSSDFIVGFPGESERDFAETMTLVEQVGYAQAYSFKYSPRPGTPASAYDLQVPEETKTERLARLQSLIAAQTLRFNQSFAGQRLTALVEKTGKKAGQMVARSPYQQSVIFHGTPRLIGSLVEVTIESGQANCLFAQMVTAEHETTSAAAA